MKTQEISLASLNDDKKVQTREVRLDAVKQPPKNVQVSVEINAAQGNASVEVTRRHDGATVVKTVDTSDSGHVYVDGEDRTDYAQFDETSRREKQPVSNRKSTIAKPFRKVKKIPQKPRLSAKISRRMPTMSFSPAIWMRNSFRTVMRRFPVTKILAALKRRLRSRMISLQQTFLTKPRRIPWRTVRRA